ncbi:fungal-specific transcription factor domain-containing protein [Trichoderma sp. SZMC 28015]
MDTTGKSQVIQHRKPLRTFKACVRCQEKKRRCDGKTPMCSSCTIRRDQCTYRPVRKTRGPGKGKQLVQALEKRLSEMESFLHRSGLQYEEENSPAVYSINPDRKSVGIPSQISSPPPQSLQWLDAPPAELPFPHFELVRKRMNEFKAASDYMRLSTIVTAPLLPQETERYLLQQTAEDLFREIPLFKPQWVLGRLEQPDALNCRHHVSWWATMNVLISMAIRLKSVNSSFRETSVFAWSFFKNAYAVFPEILLQGNDLSAVQAFLAMAMFMMTSADTRTTLFFLSLAVRASQTAGLHRETNPTISSGSATDEMRRYVFWISYTLDMELSSICGLPPLQADEDAQTELPTLNVSSGQGCMNGIGELNDSVVFRLRVQLTVINSRIRKSLYLTKSRHQSPSQLLIISKELDRVLEHWHSTIPIHLQPGFNEEKGRYRLERPSVALQFVYYHCISMVHWAVIRDRAQQHPADEQINDTSEHTPQGSVAASTRKVRSAAQATIALLRCLPPQPVGELWRLLRYPISAAIALLSGILNDTTSPDAHSDLIALDWLRQYVRGLVDDEGCDFASLLRGCNEMAKIAEQAVSRPSMETTPRSVARHTTSYGIELSANKAMDNNIQFIAAILRRATHPMWIAQGLMGNVSNCDLEVVQILSDFLGMPFEASSAYGPFVPDFLRPETYGFTFHCAARN